MPTDLAGPPRGLETSESPANDARQRSLEPIMRRYAAMVFRISFRVTHNVHDAEDATQAAFMALHQQLECGPKIQNVGGWLRQVAQRHALDMIRGRKRRVAREHACSAIGCISPEPIDREERRLIVREELEKLPARYRLPLILYYFGGMSHQEMAGEMRCKAGTLRVRLHRAKELLGRRLSSRGVDMPAAAFGLAMERVIHGAVTDAIVATARHGVHGAIASGAGATIGGGAIGGATEAGGRVAQVLRGLLLSSKMKLAMSAGAIVTTALTISATHAVSAATIKVLREIPRQLNQIIRSVAKPSIDSWIPSFQANATQSNESKSTSQAARVGVVTFTPPPSSGGLIVPSLNLSPIISSGPVTTTATGTGAVNVFDPPASAAVHYEPLPWEWPVNNGGGFPLNGISLTGSTAENSATWQRPANQGLSALIAVAGPSNSSNQPAAPATTSPPIVASHPTPGSPVVTIASTAPIKGTTINFAGSTNELIGMGQLTLNNSVGNLVWNGATATTNDFITSGNSQSIHLDGTTSTKPVVFATAPPPPLSISVPEPTSLIFVAGGLLLLRRRRRR